MDEYDSDDGFGRELPSTFAPPPAMALAEGPVAEAVRVLADSRHLTEGPHEGPDQCEPEVAFRALKRACDADALLALADHGSVVLRGYLVTHIVERRRDAIERLYPLFRDDRALPTLRG